MPDANENWIRQHGVGVAVGIVTFVWFTVELLAKRKHGDDYVLTAISIGVTLFLWLLLVLAIGRYWKDGSRSKSLKAQIVTLKHDHATQIAGYEKQRSGLEDQYKEELQQARQQHANNEAGLMKLKEDYRREAKEATDLSELRKGEIVAKDGLHKQRLDDKDAEIARLNTELSQRPSAEIKQTLAPLELRDEAYGIAGALAGLLWKSGQELEEHPDLNVKVWEPALSEGGDPQFDPNLIQEFSPRLAVVIQAIKDQLLMAEMVGLVGAAVTVGTLVDRRIETVSDARRVIEGLRGVADVIERRGGHSQAAPSNVAELVIEYSHSSEVGGNGNRPLVVRNVTPDKSAFNVSIATIKAGHGEIRFRPGIVTCIEAGKNTEFNASSDAVSDQTMAAVPIFIPNHFTHFLGGFYNDRDLNEQFEWKSIVLHVNYESAGVAVTAECEIKYRRWHQEVATGAHRIRQRKAT